MIALGTCAALTIAKRPGTGKRLAAVLAALVLVIHAGELAVSAGLSLKALTIPASDSASYADYVTKKAAAFALVPDDGTLTRTESTTAYNQDRCEPMLFGYDGISHYGSTLSQDSLDFLQRLGVDRYSTVWASYGPGVTAAADTLMGIRYVVSAALDKDYVNLGEAGGYAVWENGAALPVGWTADAAIAGELPAGDCFSYMNALYAAAAPEAGDGIFRPAAVTKTEAEGLETDDGLTWRLAPDAMSATLSYTVVPAAGGPLYMDIRMPDYPSVIVSTNGQPTAYYATTQTNGSLYLGDFAAGEAVTVQLQAFTDLAMDYAAFATEDTAALARYADALRTGGCALDRISASHFAGTFTTGGGDGLLVLTVPYDEAWRITLDGQHVVALKAQGCLTAIPVTDGTHELDMRYTPGGLYTGLAVSAAAILICAGAYILQRKKKE